MPFQLSDNSISAWFVAQKLADLLSWSSQPDSKPLPDGWADAYRHTIRSVFKSALDSFSGDSSTCKQLRTAESLALNFISLLANNPTLAVMPVHEWPVAAYRQRFDDLAALEREFRILSNTDEQPAGKPATTEPAAAETLESIDKPAAAKPPKRVRTKKRWTFSMVQALIESVLKSQDPDLIKVYIFEPDKELAKRIGCNKQTLYKTRFWRDERERMQAEWRRMNSAGEIPKKRDQ